MKGIVGTKYGSADILQPEKGLVFLNELLPEATKICERV